MKVRVIGKTSNRSSKISLSGLKYTIEDYLGLRGTLKESKVELKGKNKGNKIR